MSVPTLIPIAHGVSLSDVIDASVPNEDKPALVHVEDLHKTHGNLDVRRGITVEIKPGDMSGLLARSGTEETTPIEIPEGLRQPESGTVTVCGMDPARRGRSSVAPGPLLPFRL
jgi:ABC-2 type transport system ATP-binding protein